MRNAWMAVLGVLAAWMVSAAFAACGAENGPGDGNADGATSDDTPGDDGPGACGDGTCAGDETCASCEGDCGCAETQACRDDACVDTDEVNPLIAKMPGTWMRIEPNDGLQAVVTVDASNPTCERDGISGGDPGDACVYGFSPQGRMILAGAQLRWHLSDFEVIGQVLDDGRRVEFYACSVTPCPPEGNTEPPTTYVKQD